ncbi:protein TANC2-like isoform X2 [Triticum dicoccoides]|uniref:protein TANC2-like isoform X2 n=1 Tax=Triticum dicoccoides TaxID=85692 RepID=UPI00188EAC42|nr:protein TANC2-like isoform X2 [Triticum dicoccoides]
MSSSTDAMASPCSHDQFDEPDRGTVLNYIFQAASDDELSIFKELVTIILDNGRGRPKEAIEELRVEDVGQLEGFSALHIAASKGSLEVCRYLVEELLVDVDLVDKEGRTPLLFATYHNGGTAEYLLDHGANQDKADHDGSTLLHYAAELGNCEMVELLLAKGAYVDPVSACGTPLHVAAGKGHYGAMKILLDHNADYNKMVNGVTPLIVATDAKSMKCIKLLVKAGANLKEAAAYTTLHAEKVVSDYFLNCIMEDVDANRDVPFDGPMLKREIVTSGLISRGSNSLKNKDYVVAAKLYSKAMVLDPDDAVLFSDRSLCWLQLGDGKTALLDANRCRKMRPHWPKACHRQGEALMLLKDYEGASERFWDGLKLDPVDTDIEDALRISECHFVLSSMPMPSCHIPT